MIRCLTRGKRGKRGFTMMEVLVVVGIIAVIAAIAIPSVISMRKNMDYKQRCDYAKTIFLAAQSNLADLRSTGELKNVAADDVASKAVLQSNDTGMPDRFTDRYIFIGTGDDRYDAVLPVNSVESVIRDQSVIIEYNPRTGGVYSVFYAEGNPFLAEDYRHGRLQRNEEWLKKNTMGYYNGGDLTGEELGFYEVVAGLSYVNGQEGILNIDIPTQYLGNGVVNLVKNGNANYIKGMDIHLTVIGETSGIFTKQIKKAGEDIVFTEVIGGEGASNVLRIPVVLDSLVTVRDENNKVKGTGLIYDDENIDKNDGTYSVKPGDNVSFVVEVTYVPGSTTDELILFDDAVLGGVNPLFHAVTGEEKVNNEGGYAVAIANGRHLQNLNALDPAIAAHVKTVTFVNEDGSTDTAPVVDWAETTKYYFTSNLKYFAPIDNANLVGAEIDGKHTVISNLSIASDGALNTYDYYADSASDQSEVGLFRRINGAVRDLRISNPVIRGGSNSEAVGALAGSAGSAARVDSCYVYIGMQDEGYNPTYWNPDDTFDDSNKLEYGVAGKGTVGGMVGYSDGAEFTASLSAVPVYGDMTDATGSAGVGGFVGVAEKGSFNKCYSSFRTIGEFVRYKPEDNIYASSAVGGFVGTGIDAQFTNCFATGNVYSKTAEDNARKVCGGFVGLAIQKDSGVNGLYNACYSLGTVTAGSGSSTHQAKFVGHSQRDSLNEKPHDYYKALLKNQTAHVFRDCYYLQGKTGVLNADNYTLPASFDMLYSLYTPTNNDDEYIFSALYSYKMMTVAQSKEYEIKYRESKFQKSGCWMQGYQSVGNGYYSYNNGTNGNYPYSMLTNMPFYGIWPDAPSDVRMAYVEIYHDGNMEVYYDKSDIDKVPWDKTVIADGYVIMSANGGRSYEVTFNDVAKGIPLIFTYTDEDSRNEYYYGFIPVNDESLANSFITSGSSYTKVELYDSELLGERKEYRMYFNPYVALSQKNPTKPYTEASDPGAPTDIYIHSARQLNALATKMSAFWDMDYNLIGTVDFDRYGLGDTELAKYGFDSKTVGNYGIIKYDLASIGTEANPFTGTLTGAYNATVKVQGTAATETAEAKVGAQTGLIGVLGSNGQVSGITVTGTMELGDNEGALVNVMNGGTLKDCAVNAVITSNSKTAGLVVGALNGGKISNCTFDDTDVEPEMKTSTHLGFVGVAKMTGYVAVDENAKYFTITAFEGSSIAEDKIADTFKEVAAGTTKRAYAAEIDEDCFFTVNGETTPAVKTAVYYYSISEDEEYKKSETPATEFVAVSSVKPSEFGTGNTEWKSTGYYFMRDNKYYPVSVIVTAVEKPVSQPSVVADTDGTDSGESTDPTQESTGATEPPAPQTKTVYTYAFGYNNETWYRTSEIEDPETPITLPADLPLYRLNMPVKGKTYILVNLTDGALKADGNSKVVQKNSDITEDMVWTVGADGVWFNNKETEKKITVTLGNVANGAEQHPMMKVGNIDYNVYAVSENTERNVELVDRDCEYVTTESLASKPETT